MSPPALEHAVVIAGGGPTGLMLAGELALAGVDVAIVERRPSQDLAGSRAGGLHARTIEVLDQRGIADRFLAEGQMAQVTGFAGDPLDIGDFPTRHPYGLALWQNHIERILAGWVEELAVPIYRGIEVTGFAQDDTGVDVELGDGRSLRAQIPRRMRRRTQPGPQGRRHRVPGIGPDHQQLDRRGRDGRGAAAVGHPPRRDRHPCPRPGEYGSATASADQADRRLVTEQHVGATTEPTLRELREALVAVYGTDFGVHIAHLDLPVHRCGAAGGVLPQETRAARRRRGARASARRRTGTPDRRAGCGEPGMEAGPGGQGHVAGKPARHLPGGAPPDRCARAAQHDGVDRRFAAGTNARRRCARRWPSCSSMDEPRKTVRRDDVGPGHPLRPRRGTSAARTPHARSRPGHRRRPACGCSPCCTMPGRCCSISVSPAPSTSLPWADRVQRVDAAYAWCVGAAGARCGRRSHRRVDSARRIRRVGGRAAQTGARRRADHLVRTACCGVACRGAREVQLLGDGQEVPQLTQVDRRRELDRPL